MGIEITVALVSLGGTLLGACIGSGVSIWATSKQLSLSFQQNKLDVVREQMKGLQKCLNEVTQTSTSISEPTLDADQIHARLIDAFLMRAQIFSSFSYMFSDSVEQEIEDLVGQASQGPCIEFEKFWPLSLNPFYSTAFRVEYLCLYWSGCIQKKCLKVSKTRSIWSIQHP